MDHTINESIEEVTENITEGLIDIPDLELVEVEFRSGRIAYYANPGTFFIHPEMWVIVQVDRGFDIAKVMHSSVHNEKLIEEFKKTPDDKRQQGIIRKASKTDLQKLKNVIDNEQEATDRFNEMVVKYPFEMKLIKTVYQFDGNKLTFFFTADGRVDFREFVRELAAFFRTRIELHQTTGRDVAKELGGIGMCGKYYCCSTFLKHFNQITIKMAKDQNLSGNLSKISGPCGRLLCCLNFEEEYYQEVSRDFPEVGDEVFYHGQKHLVFKNDIYNKRIYLSQEDQVSEILTLEQYQQLSSKRK